MPGPKGNAENVSFTFDFFNVSLGWGGGGGGCGGVYALKKKLIAILIVLYSWQYYHGE